MKALSSAEQRKVEDEIATRRNSANLIRAKLEGESVRILDARGAELEVPYGQMMEQLSKLLALCFGGDNDIPPAVVVIVRQILTSLEACIAMCEKVFVKQKTSDLLSIYTQQITGLQEQLQLSQTGNDEMKGKLDALTSEYQEYKSKQEIFFGNITNETKALKQRYLQGEGVELAEKDRTITEESETLEFVTADENQLENELIQLQQEKVIDLYATLAGCFGCMMRQGSNCLICFVIFYFLPLHRDVFLLATDRVIIAACCCFCYYYC